MAKNVTIQLDSAGVRELLQSRELMGCCEEIANGIAGLAEGEWEVEAGVGKSRAYATVGTWDKDTYFRNLHTNTLAKAMGAVRKGGEP